MSANRRNCLKCGKEFETHWNGSLNFCEEHEVEHCALLAQMGLVPDYLMKEDEKDAKGRSRDDMQALRPLMTNHHLMRTIISHTWNGSAERGRIRLLSLDAFFMQHLPVVTKIRALQNLETEPHFILKYWNDKFPERQVLPRGSKNAMP